MSWLILVDQERDFSNADTPHKVLSTRDYLSRAQLFKDAKPKIINLARSYTYMGTGYYCSLLAEARGHRIIPSAESIVELSSKPLYEQALPELEASLARCYQRGDGSPPPPGPQKLFVCLGQVQDPQLMPFARLLFDWFRVPILRVTVAGNGSPRIERIAAAGINALSGDERAFFAAALEQHTRRTWRDPKTRMPAKYTLAVLFDPAEELPPSYEESLAHLARIAARSSVDVEPIQKGDLARLAEFDALFIRTTTSIDNFTYRFARRAQQEGMPVIDDPQSMIRCTNKVYLEERLSAAGLPTPRTVIVQHEKQLREIVDAVGWPVVLKMPDSSFSRGVFKCEDEATLAQRLKALLAESDMVIAQAFVPTAFDWRVGVLAGEPLFVCQYHMARNHWQVIKHRDGKAPTEGRATTVAVAEAPQDVVQTAVQAARLIGDGLYGVDLKQTDAGLFVMEVNDNPDINHGYEDTAEKDAVWEKIVRWFWERLEV